MILAAVRPLLLLALVALSGCASSKTAQPQTAPIETVRVGGGGSATLSVTTVSSVSANVGTVPFSVDRVWSVLPAVYDSLRIPRSEFDAAAHVLGNTGLKLRRRLGAVTLSRLLDCGSTQGGPSADTYEVFLSILTKVQPGPEAGTAILATTVDAQARPVSFAGEYVRCGSKGELELRVLNTVKWELLR